MCLILYHDEFWNLWDLTARKPANKWSQQNNKTSKKETYPVKEQQVQQNLAHGSCMPSTQGLPPTTETKVPVDHCPQGDEDQLRS